MSEWMAHVFLWLKAIHIIAVISWMAGLLYLPRLFVYHCTTVPDSEASETFKVMEDKLSRLIMFPAMVVSLVCGLALMAMPGYLAAAGLWLWLKIALVVALLAVHRAMLVWRNAFAADANSHPQRFFRIINEVPTLIMIGIVILVVVRPF